MRVPTGSSRRSVIKWRQPVASWAAGHPLGCPSRRTSWGAWRNLYRNIVRVLTDAGRLTTAHASAVASSADVLPRFHTFWTRYVAATGGSPSSAGSPAAAPAATTDAAPATAVDTKWYADALECLCAALYVCEQPLMGKGHGDSVAVKYIHQRNEFAPFFAGDQQACGAADPWTHELLLNIWALYTTTEEFAKYYLTHGTTFLSASSAAGGAVRTAGRRGGSDSADPRGGGRAGHARHARHAGHAGHAGAGGRRLYCGSWGHWRDGSCPNGDWRDGSDGDWRDGD
jgi:hypothetical protein